MKNIKIVSVLFMVNSIFAADIYGSYVELQAGSGNSSAFNSGVVNSGGIRVDGGIKINQYMGVEAGFTGLTDPTNNNGQSSALQFYDASYKGVLPLGEMLNLHAQAGLAYGSGTLAGSGTDATAKILVGFGVDLNLAKNFAVVVNDYGYLSPNLDSSSGVGGNTNILMGGLKYNF